LKKETGAPRDICEKLQFKTVEGIERLEFLLLEYRFFRDSEKGSALLLNLHWLLSPLSLVFHIVKSRALTLLKLPCYFIELETNIIGLFAFQECHGSLIVASLGVAKAYRRLGIGTRILSYVEAIARYMGKRLLEVDVLAKNIPAQRLYAKYGFTLTSNERFPYLMKGKKPLVNY